MAGLFSPADMALIEQAARQSKESLQPAKSTGKSIQSDRAEIENATKAVLEYFEGSPAILITTQDELHNYVLAAIESGYCGIDTETTGLDRINDTIVGASLYYPGGVECYIPMKHIVYLMEQPYPNQLTYEQVGQELQLLVDAKTRMIFANADFDVPMIYKDLGVDFIDTCYYDVQTAWRCLKENEPSHALKVLYAKYVLNGKGDPKKFSDFFSPRLFPYCRPDVAKLYAANDAKITYDLFIWQLPYVTKTHPKCQKNHLEKIADLVWNIEIPMIKVCAMLHRVGVYLDKDISRVLHIRYTDKLNVETSKLSEMVQAIIDNMDSTFDYRRPFRTGREFNSNSDKHVLYLFNNMLGYKIEKTNKEVLNDLNHPVAQQILVVRGVVKLLSTYVDKLPEVLGPDGRVHATFNAIGTDTGRMSSKDPNMQNIPSHALDIRHMFRATAPMNEITDCEMVSDDTYKVTLFNFDMVEIYDAYFSQAKVHSLHIGDFVKLLIDGEDIFTEIVDIDQHYPDPYTTLTFKLKEGLDG